MDLVGSHLSRRGGSHKRGHNSSVGKRAPAEMPVVDLDSSEVSTTGFCGK